MLLKKEKKTNVKERIGLLGNAEDYRTYTLSKNDSTMAFAVGFAGGALVLAIFFANLIVSCIGGVITGMIAPRIYTEYKKEKRNKQMRMQFRDLLESLATSYSSGLNTTQAFKEAYSDMETIYGPESDICREVDIICMGLDSNINVDRLLLDWANRCEVDDIKSFAEVFEVCIRQKSDLRRIVSQTRDIINDKVDVEMEIETILSGGKNELNMMIVMPLIIVMILRNMGGSLLSDNSPSNILLKLGCLGMFVGAYLIGLKITRIKI